MNKNNPQISIILPTYNRPDLLKEAIDSVLQQTYRNFELIISNNCSTLKEVDYICKEYAAKDTRIKYYCQTENIGCVRNAEFCQLKAKNRLIFSMSDDDIISPTFLEKCIKKMQETDAIGCSSIIKYINEDRSPIEPDLDSNADLTSDNPVDNIIKWTMLKHWMGGGLFDQVKIKHCDINYKKTFAWDVLYTSQILLLGKIARVEEPLYTYQVKTKSIDIKAISDTNKDFNRFSLIDYSLDLIMRTFELVFETDKLNFYQKIEFYIKMWINIYTTKHWRLCFFNAPLNKYVKALFEEKLYNDIFYFLPCILIHEYRKLFFYIRHIIFMLKKVETNRVLIVNNSTDTGEYLQQLISDLVDNKNLKVDLLSSKSYKKYLNQFKSLNTLKTRKYSMMFSSAKAKKYKTVIFVNKKEINTTKKTDLINNIQFAEDILSHKEEVAV